MDLKRFLSVVLIFLSSCCAPRANIRFLDEYPYDDNGKDFLRFLVERTVKIEVSSVGNTPGIFINRGTGALVSQNGLILTADHVLGERFTTIRAHSCVLETEQGFIKCGEGEEAGVISRDPANDLALLRLRGGMRTKFFNLGSMDNVWRGDILWRVGMDDIGWAAGSLINPFSSVARNRMEILMPARGGASGGPIVDSAGRLVGIEISTALSAVGVVTFAAPIEVARSGLLRNRLYRRRR